MISDDPIDLKMVTLITEVCIETSKTPYVAIDERGLVNSIHLFLFSCEH